MAGDEPTRALCDARFAASALAQVQGAFDRSVEHATASLEIARAAEYHFGEGRALLGLGISAEWERDLDLAAQRYDAARARMQILDSSARLAHWRVLPVANLADIALIRGNYPIAIELGDEAVAAWREAGYLWGTAQALGTVAAARCELGDLAEARVAYRETLDLWVACADGRGIAGTIAGIAALAARAGDPIAAATLLGAAWNLRSTLGIEFVAHHLYAVRVWETVIGQASADPHRAAAVSAGERMTLDEAIAAAEAALAPPTGRARRPSPLQLSVREREVLACVVDGMHDREIAEQLSISPRTVQSHVLSILNKLGAHSRAEAVAIAIRHDLL
jgi:non-specific serine/threonine protein kinase